MTTSEPKPTETTSGTSQPKTTTTSSPTTAPMPGQPGQTWEPGSQLSPVSLQPGAMVPIGGEKGAVMFAASLNIENTRKWGFDSAAGTRVHAKLVGVPVPSAFMALLQGTAPKPAPAEPPKEEPEAEPTEPPAETEG